MRESKPNRFRRVAEARVNKIIKMMRLLGNCSNPAVYTYTEDQVQQIFTTLQAELSRAQNRYAKSGKSRFSLSKKNALLQECPTIVQSLPDGTLLRAVAYDDGSYPGINLYWDTNSPETDALICFAEYNPDRGQNHRVCIGAYRSDQDDTVYYKPYMAERESDEED